MKNPLQKTLTVLTAVLFSVSLNTFSQNKKTKDAEGKMHIKIEIEKDEKTTKVDTVINPEDLSKLNEQLKDLDINIGSLEELPELERTHAFKFEFDEKIFEKQMKEAEQKIKEAGEAMRDKEFDMKDLNEHLKEMEKNMNDYRKSFKFEFKCDSTMKLNKEQMRKELESLPGNMNFNFNYDGDGKTIIIDSESDGDKNEKDAGEKKIIIRKTEKGEGNDKNNMKEEKRVYIILKSSFVPEKQKAEFASEQVNDEKEIQSRDENDSKRARIVNEKESNSWLNNFACYPNPSSEEFTIRFHLANSEPAELKIVDLAGREVFSEKLSENSQLVEKQIKLPSNSSSAYLLILRQGNNWLHEKIFVKS
ncbi:MAG: T9SS type A sorting domain-containing protein [Bacteroidia bacterium]|nr:T9SS type A sorting domain-containing protein [Bacteroidia bacterium]